MTPLWNAHSLWEECRSPVLPSQGPFVHPDYYRAQLVTSLCALHFYHVMSCQSNPFYLSVFGWIYAKCAPGFCHVPDRDQIHLIQFGTVDTEQIYQSLVVLPLDRTFSFCHSTGGTERDSTVLQRAGFDLYFLESRSGATVYDHVVRLCISERETHRPTTKNKHGQDSGFRSVPNSLSGNAHNFVPMSPGHAPPRLNFYEDPSRFRTES